MIDFLLWNVTAADAWKCRECDVVSGCAWWRDVEAYCEDCGTHLVVECPVCGHWFDGVWDKPDKWERLPIGGEKK